MRGPYRELSTFCAATVVINIIKVGAKIKHTGRELRNTSSREPEAFEMAM